MAAAGGRGGGGRGGVQPLALCAGVAARAPSSPGTRAARRRLNRPAPHPPLEPAPTGMHVLAYKVRHAKPSLARRGGAHAPALRAAPSATSSRRPASAAAREPSSSRGEEDLGRGGRVRERGGGGGGAGRPRAAPPTPAFSPSPARPRATLLPGNTAPDGTHSRSRIPLPHPAPPRTLPPCVRGSTCPPLPPSAASCPAQERERQSERESLPHAVPALQNSLSLSLYPLSLPFHLIPTQSTAPGSRPRPSPPPAPGTTPGPPWPPPRRP